MVSCPAAAPFEAAPAAQQRAAQALAASCRRAHDDAMQAAEHAVAPGPERSPLVLLLSQQDG